MHTVMGRGGQGENESLKCVLRSEAIRGGSDRAGMMLGVRGTQSEEGGSGGATLSPAGQEYFHLLGASWVLLNAVGPGIGRCFYCCFFVCACVVFFFF